MKLHPYVSEKQWVLSSDTWNGLGDGGRDLVSLTHGLTPWPSMRRGRGEALWLGLAISSLGALHLSQQENRSSVYSSKIPVQMTS